MAKLRTEYRITVMCPLILILGTYLFTTTNGILDNIKGTRSRNIFYSSSNTFVNK